jgi:hypothetical protein
MSSVPKWHGKTPQQAEEVVMSKGWFEVFRIGRHTDSAGNTRDWTEEDLARIATSYDPAQHEAPIVLGHPATDAPAYGWVEALQVEGGKLLARPKQLAEEFRQWVREGRYKKVSIALYPDLSLRHIGFLGAMPPAVKGLAQAAFADAGRVWTYMDPYQEQTVKGLFQRLRDWLIEEKGVEAADAVISPYDLEALTAQPSPEDVTRPAFAAPPLPAPPPLACAWRASRRRGEGSGGGDTGGDTMAGMFWDKLKALFAEAKILVPGEEGAAGQ